MRSYRKRRVASIFLSPSLRTRHRTAGCRSWSGTTEAPTATVAATTNSTTARCSQKRTGSSWWASTTVSRSWVSSKTAKATLPTTGCSMPSRVCVGYIPTSRLLGATRPTSPSSVNRPVGTWYAASCSPKVPTGFTTAPSSRATRWAHWKTAGRWSARYWTSSTSFRWMHRWSKSSKRSEPSRATSPNAGRPST